MKYFKMSNSLYRLQKKEKGSFTVEASLIFPIIFLFIVLLIFLSVIAYQKVLLYYVATQAADRVAFNWNNSHKDPITGEYQMEETDGLYWRLTGDRVLNKLLSTYEDNRTINITIKDSYEPIDLSEKKLAIMSRVIPNGIGGNIIFQKNIYEDKVIVKLDRLIKVPSFVSRLIGNKIEVMAYSTTTDPVEYIRSVDLIINYSQKFNQQKELINKILRKQREKEIGR
ncbi:hypothetical protein BHF71_02505 [Vulcanibacillus modesticaldus]|uniref:TadE-like domain-containing protein n=1 Tax=Vulcanibacillus modesticaldus TaxID=337097 RepID=A0A1D2YTP1_9BACI|nr:TadE family protein [Vulcanibacillus modesticaldus]OEF99073.1 hypothetical protein BHF71_02505 [Vulcanibacillus modesticaldus]